MAVKPGSAVVARARLFGALEQAFPVSFQPGAAEGGGAEAELVFTGACEPPCGDAGAVPTFFIGSRESFGRGPSSVVFGSACSVDPRLRGISVLDPLGGPELRGLTGSEEVLASSGSRPVWVRACAPGQVHRVDATLPELAPERALRDELFERPLALVALVQFLREVTKRHAFEPPPLRASFLFDDPNLRRGTYGFIDYRELLRHADRHGYHAAMAMIPLDTWIQSQGTVSLFRAHPERLSLLFHGNNHESRELMQPVGERVAAASMAQALRRAARFEARYDLQMDRVMVPPHGMCSRTFARALGSLGFDALCAIHPLPWTERPPAKLPLAGWGPAEFGAGCAVLPRVPMSIPFWQVALRAYLNQPIIVYGHHEDVEAGLQPLERLASLVGQLGSVKWSSIGAIGASNYSTKLDGGALRVRPHSGRILVEVPEGAELLVEAPGGDVDGRFAGWAAGGSGRLEFGAAVDCGPGSVEVRLVPARPLDAGGIPDPPRRPWPVLRRAATEARDRLLPVVSKPAL